VSGVLDKEEEWSKRDWNYELQNEREKAHYQSKFKTFLMESIK
jgi:hypothetical protein